MALLEAAKNIKFVYIVLKSIDVPMEMPIVMCVENLGAIFMSENIVTSQRTKHIDVRYKFVNEYVQDCFLKLCL